MKLIVITAIKEFEKDIKQILIKSNVKSFSYQDVTGFRDSSKESLKANWFASEMNELESIIFFAFIKQENVEIVYEHIGLYNEKLEELSRIHVSILNVEKSN